MQRAAADRAHLDDLAVEELQTDVGGEDAGLAHLVVLLDVKRWRIR